MKKNLLLIFAISIFNLHAEKANPIHLKLDKKVYDILNSNKEIKVLQFSKPNCIFQDKNGFRYTSTVPITPDFKGHFENGKSVDWIVENTQSIKVQVPGYAESNCFNVKPGDSIIIKIEGNKTVISK